MKRNLGLFAFNLILIFSMLGLPIQGTASAAQAGPGPLAAGTSLSDFANNDATLVGCWQMEEGSGGTLYDGGASYSNNGHYPVVPLGYPGNSRTFSTNVNGTSQYATVPQTASLKYHR